MQYSINTFLQDSISVSYTHLDVYKRQVVTRSPRSYNSQIGVPRSVWLMNEHTELAIFEAGISEMGEMEALQTIIKPTVGILTNIGLSLIHI